MIYHAAFMTMFYRASAHLRIIPTRQLGLPCTSIHDHVLPWFTMFLSRRIRWQVLPCQLGLFAIKWLPCTSIHDHVLPWLDMFTSTRFRLQVLLCQWGLSGSGRPRNYYCTLAWFTMHSWPCFTMIHHVRWYAAVSVRPVWVNKINHALAFMIMFYHDWPC